MALAVVPCVAFVGIVIAVLAMMPASRPTGPRNTATLPAMAAATPAPASLVAPVADFDAEIKIPAHHAMAAIQDLPVFDVPDLPEPVAARITRQDDKNDVARIDVPRNDIVPVKPEKEEKEGCFGTAVNFVPTPAEAFNAARKEKRLTMILHVSGNFEDSGFT